MNVYLESQYERVKGGLQSEPSPVEYAQISGIPKTPLQRALTQDTRPQRTERQVQTMQLTQNSQDDKGTSLPLAPSTSGNINMSAIAALIVQQQRVNSLPSRDLHVFNGEPLSFRPFMQAFEHHIENNTSSSQDRLYYLEQFTSGQPKELVRSCLHMGADRGYAEAKRLLELHFGDEFKITSAYIDKALNWNSIESNNGEALQSYTLSSWLL
ncbi:uncharacterized protein LOC117545953 [Tachysurus ichikawai]